MGRPGSAAPAVKWKRKFPEYQVPDAIERLVKAGLLRDVSARADAFIPTFETKFPDGSVLVLLVDHPSHRLRWDPGDARYHLWLEDKGILSPVVPQLRTDNLDELLYAVRSAFEEKGGPRGMENR